MTNFNKVSQFSQSSMASAVLHSLHNIEQEAKRAGFGHPAYAAALLKAVKKARKAFAKAHATPEIPAHVNFPNGALVKVNPVLGLVEGQTTRSTSLNNYCTFVEGAWVGHTLRVMAQGSELGRDDDGVKVVRLDGGRFWDKYTDVTVSASWLRSAVSGAHVPRLPPFPRKV